MLYCSTLACTFLLSACATLPAVAQTPDAVARLIDAALQSDDAAGLEAVIRYAKKAYPQSAESIDAQVAAYRAANAAPAPVVPAAQDAKNDQARIEPAATVKYSGEGELGAFTTTGNAPGIGLAAGLKLTAEGDDWRLAMLSRADYQETSNVVVREQYRVSAEPNYKFNTRGYVYGLGQYEQDRFQGFHARYSVSGGVGYSVLTGDDAQLSVKAGPAWRYTRLVTGTEQSVLAGLASVDIKLKLTPSIQLTEAASAYVDEQRSTLFSVAALDSQLIGKLKARLSYTLQYESNPALRRAPTDTTSRLTLVYGF